jgi:hypothetical protein
MQDVSALRGCFYVWGVLCTEAATGSKWRVYKLRSQTIGRSDTTVTKQRRMPENARLPACVLHVLQENQIIAACMFV